MVRTSSGPRINKTKVTVNKLNKQRQTGGQTSPEEDQGYARRDNTTLIAYLRYENPKVRTSAAKILGQRQCLQAVMPLCQADAGRSAI